MIQQRWVTRKTGIGFGNIEYTKDVLQYRQIIPCVDASGCLCPGGDWSEWIDVPHEEEK